MLGFLVRKAKENKIIVLLSLVLFFVFLVKGADALSIPGLLGLSSIDEFINDPVNYTFNAIYKALAFVLLSLAGILVWFGSILLDIMLEQQLYTAVLTLPIIEEGWKTVRDFCNMFYIFFLLIIAFATILRVQAYSAKSLLPKVLVSVILINFSLVITKIVIDFGQVFMFGIAGWMGGGFSGSASGMSSIVAYFKGLMANNPDPDLYAFFLSLFSVSYVSVLGLLYIMLAGFLLIRLVYFVILMILSPFAFFSMVLPSMRTYATQWWSALIKNSISGAVFLFFIYLSLTMAGSLTYSVNSVTDAFWVTFFSSIMPHLISLILLWAAIPATSALGAAGTKQIIGGRAGLGKVAGAVGFGAIGGYKLGKRGATAATSRYLASNAPGADGARNARDKLVGALSNNRVTGTAMLRKTAKDTEKRQKAIDNEAKVIKLMSDKDKKKYVDNTLDPKTKAIREAAMFQSMQEKGGLSQKRLEDAGFKNKKKVQESLERMDKNNIYTKGFKEERLDLVEVKGKDEEETKALTAAKRLEMVETLISKNQADKIGVDSLLEEEVSAGLEKGLGKVRFEKLVDSFSVSQRANALQDKEDEGKKLKGKYNARVALGVEKYSNMDEFFKFSDKDSDSDVKGRVDNFMKDRESAGLYNFTGKQLDSVMGSVNGNHVDNSPRISLEMKEKVSKYAKEKRDAIAAGTIKPDKNEINRIEHIVDRIDNSMHWESISEKKEPKEKEPEDSWKAYT